MIKKIISFLIIFSVVLSYAPAVYADNATEEATDKLPHFHRYIYDYRKFQANECLLSDKTEIIDEKNAEEGNALYIKEGGSISFETSSTEAVSTKLWARIYNPSSQKVNVSVSLNDSDINNTSSYVSVSKKWQWIIIEENLSYQESIPVKVEFKTKGDIYLDSFIISNRAKFIPGDNDNIYNNQNLMDEIFIKGKFGTVGYSPEKNEHPRVLLNKKLIPEIKENFTKSQNIHAYNTFKSFLEIDTDGVLPIKAGQNNFDDKVLSYIQAYAFQAVIYNDEEFGVKAKDAILNYLGTSTTTLERELGHIIYVASLVYDWCYMYFSDNEKEECIAGVLHLTEKLLTISDWLNRDRNNVGTIYQAYYGSHGSESMNLRDWNCFGIAVYDEYPQVFEYMAGAMETQFKPIRDYLNTSHTLFQGTSYGLVRPYFDMCAMFIYKRAFGRELFSDDIRYTYYDYIYSFRPDDKVFRDGDEEVEEVGSKAEMIKTRYFPMMISSYYKDSYLKGEFYKTNKGGQSYTYNFMSMTPVEFLLYNDPDVEPADLYTLPDAMYFPAPGSKIIARTGWNRGVNSPDVSVFMKLCEEYSANHQHLDSGSFQIYYKGQLTGDSSVYALYGTKNDMSWSKETISHNGLLIYDPEEKPRNVNYTVIPSGGQIRRDSLVNNINAFLSDKNDLAKLLGWEIDPDNQMNPRYSYLSGDLTPGYSTKKVNEVRRSMIFMPTDDPKNPGVFIVMDKIDSKKASYKKSFLLHSKVEPVIEGNTTIIERTDSGYNGRLTVQTLYPENPVLNPIGGPGRQWEINGTNYPPAGNYDPATINENMNLGWGRVEISPSKEQNEDFFLNAMYVSDADTERNQFTAKTIETDLILGAQLIDKVAVFSKEQTRISKTFGFEFESETECDIAVTGIKSGKWDVYLDGKIIATKNSYDDGGMIYFKSKGGKITLKPTGEKPDAKPETIKIPEPSKNRKPIVYVNGFPWYAKVDSVMENGRIMVSEEMMKNIEVDINFNPDTGKIVASKRKITIEMQLGKKEAEKYTGKVHSGTIVSDIEPKIINGNLMLPLRFLVEETNGNITWDAMSLTASVTAASSLVAQSNEVTIIDCKWSAATTTGFRAFDGDYSSRWAANTSEGGQWLQLQFDDLYEIERARTVFYSGADRQYEYELFLSEDGENWIKIDGGLTDGKGDYVDHKLDKPIKARYAKIIGYGSTAADFITINEMQYWHTIKE